jgi:hypothetical protein
MWYENVVRENYTLIFPSLKLALTSCFVNLSWLPLPATQSEERQRERGKEVDNVHTSKSVGHFQRIPTAHQKITIQFSELDGIHTEINSIFTKNKFLLLAKCLKFF